MKMKLKSRKLFGTNLLSSLWLKSPTKTIFEQNKYSHILLSCLINLSMMLKLLIDDTHLKTKMMKTTWMKKFSKLGNSCTSTSNQLQSHLLRRTLQKVISNSLIKNRKLWNALEQVLELHLLCQDKMATILSIRCMNINLHQIQTL